MTGNANTSQSKKDILVAAPGHPEPNPPAPWSGSGLLNVFGVLEENEGSARAHMSRLTLPDHHNLQPWSNTVERRRSPSRTHLPDPTNILREPMQNQVYQTKKCESKDFSKSPTNIWQKPMHSLMFLRNPPRANAKSTIQS